MRRRFSARSKAGSATACKVPHEDLKDREQYARHEERAGNAQGRHQGDTKDDEASRRQQKQQRSTGSWEEPDSSILDDRRGELPEFPCETMPPSGNHGSTRAAHGAGVTADHVAVPAITIASGLVGTAMRVRASRSWSEPLTLWSALIGFSGTGKTPAST